MWPRKIEKIVETATEQLREATDYVRKAQLVSVPDDPVEIIVMPEFQRGVARLPACPFTRAPLLDLPIPN